MLDRVRPKIVNWLLRDVHLDRLEVGKHTVIIDGTNITLPTGGKLLGGDGADKVDGCDVGLSDGNVARLPSATEGQVLKRGASSWQAGAANGGGPSYIHVALSIRAYSASQGTWVAMAAGPNYAYSHSYLSNSPGNNGDYVTYTVWLPAGNYRGGVGYYKDPSRGILSVAVDDIVKASVDCYIGSNYNIGYLGFDFTLTSSGEHSLKFKVDGKNASSSGYGMNLYEPAVGRY